MTTPTNPADTERMELVVRQKDADTLRWLANGDNLAEGTKAVLLRAAAALASKPETSIAPDEGHIAAGTHLVEDLDGIRVIRSGPAHPNVNPVNYDPDESPSKLEAPVTLGEDVQKLVDAAIVARVRFEHATDPHDLNPYGGEAMRTRQALLGALAATAERLAELQRSNDDWALEAHAMQTRAEAAEAALQTAEEDVRWLEAELVVAHGDEASMTKAADEAEAKYEDQLIVNHSLSEKRDVAEAKVAALTEALRPWATVLVSDDTGRESYERVDLTNITFGDLRRARAALAGIEGKNGGDDDRRATTRPVLREAAQGDITTPGSYEGRAPLPQPPAEQDRETMTFPRRNRIDLLTPMAKAIYDAHPTTEAGEWQDAREIIARTIVRSYCDTDAEFVERWADKKVTRHNAELDADRILAALAATGFALSAAPSPEEQKPVAWRVKDFADGWILCYTKNDAEHQSRGNNGALIQPLYAAPSPARKTTGEKIGLPLHKETVALIDRLWPRDEEDRCRDCADENGVCPRDQAVCNRYAVIKSALGLAAKSEGSG